MQNYVVLTLPSIYADERLEIYQLTKTATYEDKTHDYMSRRDRRLAR
jgi:hypothetical protein